MKILFDAFWWVSGPYSNRTVQREFIQAWAHEFPDDELTMLLPRRDLAAAASDAPRGAQLIGTRLAPHAVACAFAAAAIGRRRGADLVLTHNFAPLFGPSAVFIHDVLFQTDPEWFTRPERAYFALMPLLAPRADLVVTSSRTEAERIEANNPRLHGVVPIGLAVRTALAHAQPQRPDVLPELDGFLLTVGRLNVRKNLATTMAAALGSGTISPRNPLVVVGEPDGRSSASAPAVRDAISDGSIVIMPSVSDAELAWLYGNARLFVFLTLDEGFGLTPVEALSFGGRCLVSDIAVFRENLGDRVRYTDPLDVQAAAAAINEVLDEVAAAGAPPRDEIVPDLSWVACVRRLRAAATASSRPGT